MNEAPLLSITAQDGHARTGVLHLAHGNAKTPLLMPVGSQGTVKGVLTLGDMVMYYQDIDYCFQRTQCRIPLNLNCFHQQGADNIFGQILGNLLCLPYQLQGY